MARRIVIAAFSASLAFGAAQTPASEPDPVRDGFDKREFTCPVGGAKFSQDVGYSTFPLITFPDGSYPGDEGTDAEIPVCPGNGLVLIPAFEKMGEPGNERISYTGYSQAELSLLPALIADPFYLALKPDGRHIQALWIASRLGRPAFTRFNLLQRGGWAAIDPALRKRMVERLAAEGPALIDSADFPGGFRRRARYFIVNALRELGRFDEALALIDSIEREGPPVSAPVDPDSMYGPGAYAAKMRAVIAAKDMDRYPVALMPDKWAASICADEERRPPYGPKTAATKAACARRSAEQRREQAEADAASREADRLERDPAALSRACAATPIERRTPGLQLACAVSPDGDKAAGEALAKDGPKLAAACEATPRNDRSGALSSACTSWESALEFALADAVAADDPAFALLCPGDGLENPPNRASIFYLVCSSAVRRRADLASERLRADPAALDARCASVPDGERDAALGDACMRRGWEIEQAGQQRIASDPKAYAAGCGAFTRQLSRPDDFSGGESDELRYCRKVKELRDGTGPAVSDEAEYDFGVFDEHSSLSIEARARAAAIVAKAKAEGTYPKRRSDDTD